MPKLTEKQREYHRAYRTKNAECIKHIDKAYQQKHSLRLKLRRKGLHLVDHIDYIEKHSGLCDICGGQGGGKWNTLNIDHCHSSSTFRGLLCNKCNLGLGHFRDSPELLQKAIIYLCK